MSTKLSEELKWRGLVGQTTIDDLSALDQPGAFYFGADPSADSMTIGNLAGLVTCLRFIRAGYKAIFLAGGATGRAGGARGDPDRPGRRGCGRHRVGERGAARRCRPRR